jgi:adenylate cyclase
MNDPVPPESDAVIANPLRASGLVDLAALERARAHVREHGGLLSDALLRLDLVKEGDFLRVFAELYSTRHLKSDKVKALPLDELTLERVGVHTAERLRMCPIGWDSASYELQVVAAAPLSANLEPELRQLLGAKAVVVYMATSGAVDALIRRAFYGQEDAFAQVSPNGAGPVPDPDEDTPGPRTVSGVSRTVPALEPNAELAALVGAPAPPLQRADLRRTQPGVQVAQAPAEARADAAASDATPADGKTVMVSLEALTIATLRRENARYRIAQEFHRRVSLERSVEAMVDRILTVIFELLPADGAAVWLASGQYASKSKDGKRTIEVPRAVIEEGLRTSAGLLTNNALMDERFDRSKTVVSRGVKSVMTMPLRAREGVIGILYVESVSMSAAFTNDDLPLLDSIAAQAALMLDNAALVAEVQREVETRVSLSRFLSQAAIDEVLSGRMQVNLEGQAQDVTVLFADLRGFTSMSSHMRPEEVVRFLNTFFSEAVDAVQQHGGIVDKFIGDCVMAVWGAVSPRPDDPRQAIKAALEIVERARRIRVNGAALELGVGINTGRAVVGAIGGKSRSDYTCIGATVNLAARLCSLAEEGEVLITADTLMLAGPGVVNEGHEPIVLKGLETPIVPYRVRAIVQPLQLRQQALKSPGASPPRSR